MTPRENFRLMLRERRDYPRGSHEWNYRTRAARWYLNIIAGIPACEWVVE